MLWFLYGYVAVAAVFLIAHLVSVRKIRHADALVGLDSPLLIDEVLLGVILALVWPLGVIFKIRNT
jgi:hypothetical protein